MDIVFARLDERLVHGQVMTSWSKHFQIKKIIICDDDLVKDSFTCEVLSLAAPSGVVVIVKSVEDTLKEITNDDTSTKTMLLFKNLKYVLALAEGGFDLKRINIGNMGSSPSRNELTRRVFMSSDEKEIVKKIQERGIDIYLQMLYTDPEVDINHYL